MMYRGKSVVSSSLINTFAGMISLAAGFTSSVIVARLLGVEGSGIIAYALWIMTLATLVSDFGMPQATLRFIAGNAGADGMRSLLFTALTKRFVATTSLMAIGILGYSLWLYTHDYVESALVTAAISGLFLSYAYSTMSLGAAYGLGQFGEAAARTLIGCVVQPIAIFIGALLIGPPGAILGHAARHLPQALGIRKYLGRGPAPGSLITSPMRKYARDNWLSGGLSAILESRVELAIIGLSFSLVDVGYYAVGMTMTGMVTQLSIFLLASLVPYFGSLHDRDDVPSLTVAYQRTLRWLGIVLAPICFGGAAISSVLIPTLFGQKFEPAADIAEVLLAFSFATALISVPARMMLARERSAEVLRLSALWGGVSIVLMLVVVPYFGGLGAAYTKGAISVLYLISFLWYCQRRLAIPFIPMDIVKIVAAGLLTGVTAEFCLSWAPGLVGMMLGIAAGAVVYPTSILLFSVIPADEREQISKWVFARLPARISRRRKTASAQHASRPAG
jgi:O-antigen/teichoic acid export membrane protein